MRITRRKAIVVLVLAVVAAGMGLEAWELKCRAPLPRHLRDRMPGYWRTVFIGPADVREAVRGLYARTGQDRRAAARTLRNMGPRAEPAAPWLLATLADGNPVTIYHDGPNPLLSPDDRPAPAPTPSAPAPPLSVSERVLASISAWWQPPDLPDKDYASSEAGDALAEIGGPVVPQLIEALHDPVPEVRIEAARALGNINDPRALSPLRQAMADHNDEVRKWVVYALGQFDHPASVEALAAACRDFTHFQKYDVGDALGDSGAAGRKVLLDMLRSSDDDFRRVAADGLADAFHRENVTSEGDPPDEPLVAAPPEPGLIEGLVAASHDPNEYVVSCAVEALGPLRDERVVPALIEALRHDSAEVRERAVSILCARQDKRAEEPLIAALCEQLTDSQACHEASVRLFNTPQAVKPLLAALKYENVTVRVSAVHALGYRRDPAVIGDLAPLLDDPEKRVRREAAAALARLGDDRGLDILLQWDWSGEGGMTLEGDVAALGVRAIGPLVKHAEKTRRLNEVNGVLALIKDPQALDALMALAADKKSPVREGAVRALGNMTDRRAADLLAVLIEDAEVRTVAFETLTKRHDERALAPLLAQLDSPNWEELDEAMRLLGDLGDRRAAEPILAVLAKRGILPQRVTRDGGVSPLAKEDYWLRPYAARALCQVGDPRGVPFRLAVCADIAGDFEQDSSGVCVADVAIPGEAAYEPLVAALADPREAVRYLAAAGLVQLAGSRAAAPLRQAFDTLTPQDRHDILEYMARLKDGGATDFLCDVAATDGDCEVRAEAIKLLPYRSGPEVVPAIRRIAEGDPCRSVRITAWRCLWRLTGQPRPAGVASRWIDR